MLFAFRNTLLIVKKIAVLFWGQKHRRGYVIDAARSQLVSTSRDRPKSAPYPRLKNSKKSSKCQVFSFTVLENQKFFEKITYSKKWTEWRAGAR